MLRRISFALVADPRASYSHFILNDGSCAAVDSIDEIDHAHVGILHDFRPLPSELQLSSVLLLAEMATAKSPMVEITFGPGTSPFTPAVVERQVTVEA